MLVNDSSADLLSELFMSFESFISENGYDILFNITLHDNWSILNER